MTKAVAMPVGLKPVWRLQCYLTLLSFAFFSTAITAFHTFQTIAPSHGSAANLIWEGTLRGSGIILSSYSTMEQLVTPEGYPLIRHTVETEDGYLLGLYQIPHGRTNHTVVGRPVALLQHGLLECSASWVNNGPRQSLGFILADAGYDVWLGNSRGNTFSRAHAHLDPESAAFWAFSWDDMAAHDVPAMVDYVLAHTGAQRLAYVAHSQGTTIGFAALSSQPRLQAQVSVAVMMAPVAFVNHMTTKAVLHLAELGADELFNLLGAKEFLPSRKVTIDIFGEVCTVMPLACVNVIEVICGYNAENINATRLPIYLSYDPAGTSVRNMVHWAQGVRSPVPVFQKYDYGISCTSLWGLPRGCNQRHYGSLDPPQYPLNAITNVPVALISGKMDRMADVVDVALLEEALPPGAVVFRHEEPRYQHLDFTWGANAHRLIYPHVLQLLDKYHLGRAGDGMA